MFVVGAERSVRPLDGADDVLLAGGADPNVWDRFGWSPLHQAVSTGNVMVIEALLAGGADPDADDHGKVPADLAEQNPALSATDV